MKIWRFLPLLAALAVTPAGAQTQYGIGDLPPAGAVSATDTSQICQQPAGCHATDPTVTLRGVTQTQLVSFYRSQFSGTPPITYNAGTGAFGLATDSTLTVVGGVLHAVGGGGGVIIPSAGLLNGNGSVLGSVALGANLSLSGVFPNQTLNAAGGGGGTPGGSSGQTQYNAGGGFGGYTMSGSCTINTVSGVITCPLVGNAVESWTRSGNTTNILTQGAGGKTAGHQVVYDASGNGVDGGAPGSGGTVTSITCGTGLSGGTITTTGTCSMPSVGPGANSYTNANITLDAQGRVSAASNGSGGGGTPTNFSGTGGGTSTALTISSVVPSGFAGVSGNTVTALSFLTTNGVNPTLNVNGTGAKPIKILGALGAYLNPVGGEIPTAGPVTFFLDTGATNYVLQTLTGLVSGPPISVTDTVSPSKWASCQFYDILTAGQTITLPSAATIPTSGCIQIKTGEVNATLAATGSDVINNGQIDASTAGGSIPIPATGYFVVTTKGVAGATAFNVNLGSIQYSKVGSWGPGIDLSTWTNGIRSQRFSVPRIVYSIACVNDLLAGAAQTMTFKQVAGGLTVAAGTTISTAPFDMNAGTLGNNFFVTLTSAPLPLIVPATYYLGVTVSGSATGGSGQCQFAWR